MGRLVPAFFTALALHVLLLMMVVPHPSLRNPEVRGSGQVTVSIVRSPAPARESEIESPVTDAAPEAAEEAETHEQEPIANAGTERPKDAPRPLAEKQVEKIKPVAVKSAAFQATEPEKHSEAAAEQTGEQSADRATDLENAAAPAAETLRDPAPVEHLNRPPAYPALARKRGWEGTVILEVDIMKNGMVKDIIIRQGSSHELLDREALRAVREWRFHPGTRGSEPVEMKVLVPVHFLLQEQ